MRTGHYESVGGGRPTTAVCEYGTSVMIIIRLLSVASLLVAVAAGAQDIMLSWSAKHLIITPLGKAWFNLHASSLNTLQAAIERHLSPGLWDPWMITLLQWPAWAVLAGFAFLLMLLTKMVRA